MAITNRARRAQIAKAQKTCDDWNERHPVGSPVMVKLDGRDEPQATHTRSTAQLLPSKEPVIWLEGVSGAYLLTHVRAAATSEEQAAASADLIKRLGVY